MRRHGHGKSTAAPGPVFVLLGWPTLSRHIGGEIQYLVFLARPGRAVNVGARLKCHPPCKLK